MTDLRLIIRHLRTVTAGQLFLLAGLSFAIIYLWQQLQLLRHDAGPDLTTALTVVSIEPKGLTDSNRSIIFSFSDPVDPHAASHAIHISPEVDGQFLAGDLSAAPTIIRFVPTKPFPPDITFRITIDAGLQSKQGKPLLAAYLHTFTTRRSQDGPLQFVYQNHTGRVISIPADQRTAVTLKGSFGSDGSHLSLYRTDEETLLRYLTYTTQTTKNGLSNTTNNHEWYPLNPLDYHPTNLVQELPFPKGNDPLSLSVSSGIYYLTGTDTTTTLGGVFLVAAKTGLLLRQDDTHLVLSAFDTDTGHTHRSPLTVSLYRLDDHPQQLHQQQLTEEATIPWPFDNRIDLVLGKTEKETLLVPVNIPDSAADLRVTTHLDQEYKIFLHTDRPIYQPKDTIKFHGVVRVDDDALYQLPPAGTPVRVWMNDQKTGPSQIIATTATGTISGEFPVPSSGGWSSAEPNTQSFELYATVLPQKRDYQVNGTTSIDVASYTKPTFDLTASTSKTDLIHGETADITIKGSLFTGQPLAHEAVTYTWYTKDYYEIEKAVYNSNFNVTQAGGMCGGGFFNEWYGTLLHKDIPVTLGPDGTAHVTFDTNTLTSLTSQTLTMVATKTDTAGNQIVAATSIVVHGAHMNVFFMPSASRYKSGEDIVAPIYGEYLTGEKAANTAIRYRLVELQWEENNKTVEAASLASGTTQTDSTGRAIIRFPAPVVSVGKTPYLIADMQDGRGGIAEGRKSLYIVPQSTVDEPSFSPWDTISQTYLKIASRTNSYTVGDTITLDVQAPADIDTLLSAERGRVYTTRTVHLSPGANIVTIPVTEELSPSITLVFSFFHNGTYHTEGVELNVPAMHRLLAVAVHSDKPQYVPGQTAQITVTTTTQTGTPVVASVALGIVDKAIFALRKNAAPAMHSSFYYFRSRQTNASSSLTPVGAWEYGGRGGGGGGGGSTAGKIIDTLYWDPHLRTDTNGSVTVSVPLGNTVTTWRATAYGDTDHSQFGQGDTEFLVAP